MRRDPHHVHVCACVRLCVGGAHVYEHISDTWLHFTHKDMAEAHKKSIVHEAHSGGLRAFFQGVR